MGSNIENLLKLMGKNHKLRGDIRDKLLKEGKSIVGHLLLALKKNPSSTVRRNAALILGELGNDQAVEPLIRALRDRVISVSSNAAIALGMLGDKRAVGPLIQRLSSSAWQVRLNAAISLGWLADSKAINSLLILLHDHHAYVRRGAAFALGQCGDWKLRQNLVLLLTDQKRPVYEAAVVLAHLGDLSGYFYLDTPIPIAKTEKAPKKTRKKAIQALRLGNLFYNASLFPSALTEYRRALTFKEKVSDQIYFSILNNIANAFRSLGQPEQAVIFYKLSLRIKPRDKVVQENLRKAEIIYDVQELLEDRLKQWMMEREATQLSPPPQILKFFQSLADGFEEEVGNDFLRHVIFGWKTFYGLEHFRGQKVISGKIDLPLEFLTSQIPNCHEILTKEASFRSFYLLLLKLSDAHVSSEKEKEVKKQPELLSILYQAFLYGYTTALLQKIWRLSHLTFSLN